MFSRTEFVSIFVEISNPWMLTFSSKHLVEQDDLDEMELQKMEEARKSYMAAVSVSKEKRDEESIAAAANARLHLQSLVFKSKNFNL